MLLLGWWPLHRLRNHSLIDVGSEEDRRASFRGLREARRFRRQVFRPQRMLNRARLCCNQARKQAFVLLAARIPGNGGRTVPQEISSRLQRLQELDQVFLLLLGEAQIEVPVVVVDDVAQGGETAVVIESPPLHERTGP